ncbi:DoxX family protein [Candidatus Peregrinibacteria bacterium]|nr:DoxX family protein [Candidatus Peregrinibacteria bacterium]
MCFRTLHKNKDLSILFLRIVIAAIFLSHGYTKWAAFDGTLTVMNILAIAEPLGGVAMLIGLFTRWAGLGLAIIMLGAMRMKIGNVGIAGFAGMGGWEFDALIFAACVMIMTIGAGKYSLDAKTGWN